MDWTYEQLKLTEVNKSKTPAEQRAQWQMELNHWFEGFETIRQGNDYIIEERVVQMPSEVFNKAFGTKLKY